VSKCSACQADVVFVRNEGSGRTMILDAKPEKRVVLLELGDPIYSVAQVLPALQSGTATGQVASVFVDHHATCPNVDQFRRST